MLYLALSCLQGRVMQSAAESLLKLGPHGLQLTPGNSPSAGFEQWLTAKQIPFVKHHGFHWHALRRRVWSHNAECLTDAASVHPPRLRDEMAASWYRKAENGAYQHLLLETMVPGYCLGTGTDLMWAMDVGLNLAIDVSHIYIQRCEGVLHDDAWKRLQDYDRIGEIHVSANDGRIDNHQTLSPATFGLEWIRDRATSNLPVVLECYMHHLTEAQCREQFAILRDFA